MTTSPTPIRPPGTSHPAVATALRIAEEVQDLLSLDPGFMARAEKELALLAWGRVAWLVEAERLRLLAVSGDVADAHGARDAGAWLAHHTRVDHADGRRDLKLAEALRERWSLLDDALAQGRVNPAQARAVAHALGELPADVGTEVLAKAEAWLLDQAQSFGPKELRVLGRKVLDVVAPELGEQAELRALEAEEARARTLVRLTSQRVGDGTTIIRARISDAAADRLTTYLHAYASPGHLRSAGHDADPDPSPYPVRLGRAFEAFLEDVDPTRLPLHGGNATSVVVMVDEAELRAGIGVATTADGQRLSIGQVRRLACSAGILPVVMSGRSEVLDVGRRRRLFTHPQRVALAVRDRGCRADGCDMPAAMCDAHHLDEWGRGGRTDLARGILLCSFHHHRVHDPAYRFVLTPQRRVELTRINRRT
jgi:hypothetical protein